MIDDDRRGAMTRDEGNGKVIQVDRWPSVFCFPFEEK